jgi:hypothetical protein
MPLSANECPGVTEQSDELFGKNLRHLPAANAALRRARSLSATTGMAI